MTEEDYDDEERFFRRSARGPRGRYRGRRMHFHDRLEYYYREEFAGFMLHHDRHVATAIMKQMNRRRATGEYCDITLVVGENKPKEIRAHKLVLSSYTKYFKDLLSPNSKEGHLDRIVLKDVHPKSVQRLVEFAYTGRIQILTENLENILATAHSLNVESVVNACATFMKDNLLPENCISTRECAEHYQFTKLAKAAKKMLMTQFDKVIECKEFYEIPTSKVAEILGDEELTIRIKEKLLVPELQEMYILKEVVKYVKRMGLEMSPDAVELFQHVRIPVLRYNAEEELLKFVNSDLVQNNAALKELVEARHHAKRMGVTDIVWEPWHRPRTFPGLKMMTTNSYGELYDTKFVRYDRFDDEHVGKTARITGMRLWVRKFEPQCYNQHANTLKAMEVQYSTGHAIMHGTPHKNFEEYSFALPFPEYISEVGMILRDTYFIDCFSFRSYMGRLYGPYTNMRWINDNFRATPQMDQSGYLNHVKGCVGEIERHMDGNEKVIYGLEFVYGYYDYREPIKHHW